MADRVLIKVVVPAIVGIMALLLAVIALEKNTRLDFGIVGDVAAFAWIVTGLGAVVGAVALVIMLVNRVRAGA